MHVCTSLQTDNHSSTSPLSFYRPDALRRLHYDLNWCYKILFGLVCVNSDEFFELSVTNATGHPYKLYKQRSYHSARLYFFIERILERSTWQYT